MAVLREERAILPASAVTDVVNQVSDEVVGLGPIERLLKDPEVSERISSIRGTRTQRAGRKGPRLPGRAARSTGLARCGLGHIRRLDFGFVDESSERPAPYTPPEYHSDAFNCPTCGAYAHQLWGSGYYQQPFNAVEQVQSLDVVKCDRCDVFSIWWAEKLIYPVVGTSPLPHADHRRMPASTSRRRVPSPARPPGERRHFSAWRSRSSATCWVSRART